MVIPYGRGFFWVDSHTREHKRHLVDLEGFDYDGSVGPIHLPGICDCESFRLRKDRPCKHIRQVADWIVFRMELPEETEKEIRGRVKRVIKEMF